jgi:hypothetical protein
LPARMLQSTLCCIWSHKEHGVHRRRYLQLDESLDECMP